MGLRIVYIGAGNFTNHFMYPQLSRHDIELAAVCDLVEEKANLAQKRYGFKKVYTDFRKMLEVEKPEAVFCVGGPQVHYPVGMEVLDRGFPLYVQKSPAPSSAETLEMAELAAKKGVVCHVGFNMRSAPAMLKAKEIIGRDEFGQPLMGIFRYGLIFGNTREFAVMDQHCHLVDLARYLMGEIKEVNSVQTSIPNARDYVLAVEFESGAVGTLNFTSGQVMEKEFVYLEVTGNKTFLYSHAINDLVWYRPLKGPWWQQPQFDYVIKPGTYSGDVMLESFGYVNDVANFLAAVRGDEKDISPVASAAATMKLCEEIVRQIES